jgi:hypothetical protein
LSNSFFSSVHWSTSYINPRGSVDAIIKETGARDDAVTICRSRPSPGCSSHEGTDDPRHSDLLCVFSAVPGITASLGPELGGGKEERELQSEEM